MRTLFISSSIFVGSLALPLLTHAAPLLMNNGALVPPPLSPLAMATSTTQSGSDEAMTTLWHSSIPSGSPDLILMLRSGLSADSDIGSSTPVIGDIKTHSDLAAFAEAHMRADAHVQDLALSSNSIGLTYLVPAKLFGTLPVSVPLRAEVESNGSVTISYPWYGLFLNTNDLTKTIKSAVDQALASQAVTPGGQPALSLAAQAEIFSRMYAVLSGGEEPFPDSLGSASLATAQ